MAHSNVIQMKYDDLPLHIQLKFYIQLKILDLEMLD